MHGPGAHEPRRANPCSVVCSFAKSIRRPGPRPPGPGNIGSGRWRPLPTGGSHLWREAGTHHAGGSRPRLHRNTYLDTSTSLGRAEVAAHADLNEAERGVMQKREIYDRRATASAFCKGRRNETGPNTESQNHLSGAGSHQRRRRRHEIRRYRSPRRSLPFRDCTWAARSCGVTTLGCKMPRGRLA